MNGTTNGTTNRGPRHVQILVDLNFNVDGRDHFPLAPKKGLSKRCIQTAEHIKKDRLSCCITHRINEGELFHELLVVSVHRHVMDLASLPPSGRAALISSFARALGRRMLPRSTARLQEYSTTMNTLEALIALVLAPATLKVTA